MYFRNVHLTVFMVDININVLRGILKTSKIQKLAAFLIAFFFAQIISFCGLRYVDNHRLYLNCIYTDMNRWYRFVV